MNSTTIVVGTVSYWNSCTCVRPKFQYEFLERAGTTSICGNMDVNARGARGGHAGAGHEFSQGFPCQIVLRMPDFRPIPFLESAFISKIRRYHEANASSSSKMRYLGTRRGGPSEASRRIGDGATTGCSGCATHWAAPWSLRAPRSQRWSGGMGSRARRSQRRAWVWCLPATANQVRRAAASLAAPGRRLARSCSCAHADEWWPPLPLY